MKVTMTIAMAATLLAGALPILAQTSAPEKTLTGVVGDAMCGAKHTMKGESDAECTRDCIKEGSKYALIVGKTVYTLDGHAADLDKYAGQKVTVTGAVKGDNIAVKSVAAAK